MISCRQSNEAMVKLLVESKADTELYNLYGNTALHEAIYSQNNDIVKILLTHGAPVNAGRKTNGKTPLFYAKSLETAQLLLSSGAEVNVQNKKGQSVLHLSAREGHKDLIKLFVEYGANMELVDFKGETPLSMAKEEMAQFIKESSSQMKQKSKSSSSSNKQLNELQDIIKSQQEVIKSQQAIIQNLKEENESLKLRNSRGSNEVEQDGKKKEKTKFKF